MTTPRWTPQQHFAFAADAGDLLVTAAAGSGKTAVLTERCVHLLAHARADVDQLLVLTFTEAAADEMKSRIARRLRQLTRQHPHDDHLRRQLALLDNARISTLHAFCYRLIREFFYRIDLDPAANVLDADEARLFQSQVLAEVLEDSYAGRRLDPDAFRALAESHTGRIDDTALVYALTRAHNFLDALADRTNWLDRCQLLTAATPDPLALKPLLDRRRNAIAAELADLHDRLQHALAAMPHFNDGHFYHENALEMLDRLDHLARLLDTNPDAALTHLAAPASLATLRRRTRDIDKDSTEIIKSLLDAVNDAFKSLPSFACPAPEALHQAAATAPHLRALLEAQREFDARYAHAKNAQRLLDFSDLEHRALQLLANNPDVAHQLHARYQYLLVDEYQDISGLQERILSLLRAPGPRGNLFAVGDVKQSIYSFRQANPDIFLAKLNAFPPADLDAWSAKPAPLQSPQRVSLLKNFRSRPEIVHAVNRIFDRCLTAQFGGLDYKTHGRLQPAPEIYQAPDSQPEASLPDYPRVEIHLCETRISDTTRTSPPVGEMSAYSPTEGVPPSTQCANPDTPRTSPPMGEMSAYSTTEGVPPSTLDTLDPIRREALVVAHRLRHLLGLDRPDRQPRFTILDPDTKTHRPLQPRDCVVLLRSAHLAADAWVEIFHALDLPVHARQNTGYLDATEIRLMLALLRLLDNPQQDVELAAVLRSPIGRCNESHLALIRAHSPKGPFHATARLYAASGPDHDLRLRLTQFLATLEQWRTRARRQGAARLIWDIYHHTQLLAFVRALPQGRQRHANLIGLHDRARQFDSFASQGLGRFVRFLERLDEEDADFGPAPLLNEADNVIRIMTVHNSKGLEFPVVAVAGLGREFNRKNSSQPILFDDSDLPAAARCSEPLSRTHWPTLAHDLLARDRRCRDLAEELRILYVALTRAREHLILAATGNLDKFRQQWLPWRHHSAPLPRFALNQAAAFIDWIGPALADHPDLNPLWNLPPNPTPNDPCRLTLHLHPNAQCISPDTTRTSPPMGEMSAYPPTEGVPPNTPCAHPDTTSHLSPLGEMSAYPRAEGVPPNTHKTRNTIRPADQRVLPPSTPLDPTAQAAAIRLTWQYPQTPLTKLPARLSVSELKRRHDSHEEEESAQSPLFFSSQKKQSPKYTTPTEACPTPRHTGANPRKSPKSAATLLFSSTTNESAALSSSFATRPKFLADKTPQPTEKGAWTHLLLEHLDLDRPLDPPDLQSQLNALTDQGLFLPIHAQHVDLDAIAAFFATDLGRQMTAAAHENTLQREWPFALALPVHEIYPDLPLPPDAAHEKILIRGIVDALFPTQSGLTILDFKTDNVTPQSAPHRAQAYRTQLHLYQRAAQTILQTPVTSLHLHFLAINLTLPIPPN